MKKTIIYGLMMLFIVGLALANSVVVTSNAPVSSGGQLKITATIGSQSGVNLWKIKDVSVPSSWTFIDKAFTGGQGAEHNEICGTQDNGKYGCNMLANDGSTVAETVELTYRVSSAVNDMDDVSGKWDIISSGSISNSGDFGTITGGDDDPIERSIDDGNGTMIFVIIAAAVVGLLVFFNKK